MTLGLKVILSSGESLEVGMIFDWGLESSVNGMTWNSSSDDAFQRKVGQILIKDDVK